MSITTLTLDQFVDPFEARVSYKKDEDGAIIDARFDLSGLPRLDPLLLGKEVRAVPDIVKRLCGICPVTHHLAGVRALDALFGVPEIPETARLVRSLLNYGSILDAVAPRLFTVDRDLAVALKKVGKLAMATAGCSGHFPDVAVPGGVRAPANHELATELATQLPALKSAIQQLPKDDHWEDTFSGLSMTLALGGTLDPLGNRVLLSDGTSFLVPEFSQCVVESVPGDPAPRPLVHGRPYRVGPVARSVVDAAPLGPKQAQQELLMSSVLAIAEILESSELCAGEVLFEGKQQAGEGIGIVEGPRGLLVHRYVSDASGRLIECQILTPTAQNEWWLAEMLCESLSSGVELEASIRAADPCLPITSAPAGAMGINVAEEG
ncbi:nickel-dependent hydrogenase large subunit [Corynebacterium sp. H128]|uniref:nickel-dependent hydrogenase large subunit n=1 Tax=unclassified Corynebacterium TaxID=2624378 RepID=UPI0030B5289B